MANPRERRGVRDTDHMTIDRAGCMAKITLVPSADFVRSIGD